jgi:hypothetical protein
VAAPVGNPDTPHTSRPWLVMHVRDITIGGARIDGQGPTVGEFNSISSNGFVSAAKGYSLRTYFPNQTQDDRCRRVPQ